jgi:pyridoxine 5-phosphate synthase
MLKLGVNIDHVATLREARYRGRGHGEPDPVAAALDCEAAGAHGITAHLREDRRHIQDRDVWKLREVIKTRLNLEMANAPEIVAIALKLKPDIVCLVPERRLEVTTEGGLDVAGNLQAITETRKRMNDGRIEVSLFIAPDPAQIEAAARTGSQFIELHTGAFAEAFDQIPSNPELEPIDRRREAGPRARPEGQRRARLELPELAAAASRAAPGRVEHRPQHHQPRGHGGFEGRRARDAAVDGELPGLNGNESESCRKHQSLGGRASSRAQTLGNFGLSDFRLSHT